MKELIILTGSIIVHILSSKGIALVLVLLVFWIKGKQLAFDSEKWNNYFLELSSKKMVRIVLGISGAAMFIATALTYIILDKAGFNYTFMITVIILCCSLLRFWYKWRSDKGKSYLLKRFAEVPQMILEERKRETDI